MLRKETRRLKGYLRKVAADLMRKIGENEARQQACFGTLLDAVRLPE